MSFNSLSSSSAASIQAITLAAQACALVSDALEFSRLSTASYPTSFETFADCILLQPRAKTLPIICIETFKDTSPDSRIIQATGGLLGHQYTVATVLLPDDRTSHIRADYYATTRLGIMLSDDHSALTKGGHLISRLALPRTRRVTNGPTLDALAALFRVAHNQLGNRAYDLFGRNCFWMTDLLFYCLARKFSAAWLTGTATPAEPLRRYLRGETGVLEAAVSSATPDPAARWWAQLSGNAVRGIQTFFTRNHPDRFLMHDDEVKEWISIWDNMMRGK
ncbi:hypothetical protein C8Q78DRAFT_1066949 [Trametes maxima]|nr:hypothetical protein C8Q78DRAFT_1066949 [Trametes maxima]